MAERTLLIIAGLFFLFFFCLAPASGIPEMYFVIAAGFFVLRSIKVSGWATPQERTWRAVSFMAFTLAYFSFIFVPTAYAAFPELLVGWVFFLGRTIPRVATDPVSLIIALAAATGAIASLNVLSWMFELPRDIAAQGGTAPENPPMIRWRFRWTIAILFGVVLMFASGVAAFGILESGRSIWELRR